MEIWKECKENNNYLISSLGNIKNKITNKILSLYSNKQGYLKVWLYEKHKYGLGQKRKMYFVHRLVASNFIINDKNLKEVNHKNGIVNDNVVSNLEWVSPLENMEHFFKNEKMNYSRKRWKEGIKKAGLKTSERNKKKLIILENNKIFDSISDCAKFLGTNIRNLSAVLKYYEKKYNQNYAIYKNLTIKYYEEDK